MTYLRRGIRPLCLLFALILSVQLMAAGASAAETGSTREDTDGASVLDPAEYPGTEVLVRYEDGSYAVFTYSDQDTLAEGLTELAAQSDVALVQPNYTYESTALSTSDPLVSEQWALENDGSFRMEEQDNPYPVYEDPFGEPVGIWQWIGPWWMWSNQSVQSGGQTQAKAGIDIGAEEAWALYDGGSQEVIVALVDTGIDYTHEDLTDRIWVNEDEIPGNGVDDDGNGYVDDVYGWNFYAGNNQVYVGSEDSHGTHGAGNDGTDLEQSPSYPASYDLDNLVTVANLRCDGTLDSSSSYGAVSVDLAAPGTYILSTTPGDTYSYMSGTSMAAPMVSAAAAMLYSQFPDATLADVKDMILASVQKLDGLSGSTATGGMLDLGAAMAYGANSDRGRTWNKPDLAAYSNNPPVISLSEVWWAGRRYLYVQVSDLDGDLERVAYAAGTHTAAEFSTGTAGTPVSLDRQGSAIYQVRSGGTYTFYAADQQGNETVRTVEL